MTPAGLAFADTFTVIGILAVIAGLAWILFRWLPRKWREASERVNRLADLSRCDWCDGFTTDPRRCSCTDPCTFVPLCQARIRIPGRQP